MRQKDTGVTLDSGIQSGIRGVKRVCIAALFCYDNPVALEEPASPVQLACHDVVLVVYLHVICVAVKLQLERNVRVRKKIPVGLLDVPVSMSSLRLSDLSRVFFQGLCYSAILIEKDLYSHGYKRDYIF